jgi:polysaccharide deacetylase family protein (PEP-CTERM system associated)
MAVEHDLVNAMSIDVEDYFHVSAFEKCISRSDWVELPSRVERNMERVLSLLAQHEATGTFFTLGWVAERFPQVVRSIVGEGHEIASHGYDHIRVSQQTPGQFKEDVKRSKGLLEDITGSRVLGYRAASYSIDERTLWALDILGELGFRYSSSIYPIHHDLYGMPEAPRFAFHHKGNGLLEIPISTVRLFNINLPCGGGGYFRLMPYLASRWALERLNKAERQPCVFYFHPWELDPEQPRQKASLRSRVRHYLNLGRMEKRLEWLLSDFNWDRIDRVFLDTACPDS